MAFQQFAPFTLTGSDEMIARLAKVERRFPFNIAAALLAEAEDIMFESRNQWVPVETSDLKDSGEVIVTTPKSSLFGTALIFKAHGILLQYGRNKAQDYALAVHEHPSYHSPPSWKGGSIRWTKPGTGPKYLERPLKLAQRGMAGRVALELGSLMKTIPGAFVGPSL